jgi:hypothetical protein
LRLFCRKHNNQLSVGVVGVQSQFGKWQQSGRVDERVIQQATKFWASYWEIRGWGGYWASKLRDERVAR